MTGIAVTEVGKTRCVQPGQPYEQCRVAIIDFESLNVEFWEE
jgi:hypothetical protein